MLNPENFFETYDYTQVVEQILKENSVPSDDNHYNRHMQEIKKKIEEVKRSYKAKDYFKDMPALNKDFSSYMLMANTPFVEEDKRDKFKMFLGKKLGEINEKIRDYIFPYKNEDKAVLGNDAMLILKFDSFEEAKLAASALNGFDVDKAHKVNAVTYMDFDKVVQMEDKYHPANFFSFTDLIKWEESNLIEMVMARCNNRVFIGSIHYFKKEFTQIYSLNLNKNVSVKWSPQGKFLVANEGNSLKFYGGSENFNLKAQLDYNVKDYLLSNNESFLITFSGHATGSSATGTKGEVASKEQLKENVFIWDLLRNDLIRGLAIGKDEKFENFKWSSENKYFGRIKKDILIVYEAPKMQMLPDSQGVRQPIKDNIKDFFWFPNRSIIITLSEKRSGKSINESILQFVQIPSRRTFPAATIAGLEVVTLEWHKNNFTLSVLCKSSDKNPKWSVRIFEFDNVRHSYRSMHTSLFSGDVNYYSVSIKWIGNDLFVASKFRDSNLDTLSVYPFKLEKKTLKVEPWPSDKILKNMKHSSFIPSSNGVHFILACMDMNNTNNYGKVDLYSIFDNTINYCRSFEFSSNLENIKWDQGGRLFRVELTRKTPEGTRFYDCEGNLLYDCKDASIINLDWRPRHTPALDKNVEEEDIKKNFKNIGKLYEEEDSEFLSAIDKIKRAERKKIRENFMSTLNRRRATWDSLKAEREKLVPYVEPVIVEHEFVIEEIIHTTEEILNTD